MKFCTGRNNSVWQETMAADAGSEAPAWTAIARLDAKPPPPLSLLASAGSRAGVRTLVLDTGILLNSNLVYSLPGTADQFVTITEALEEIRDPSARAQLAALPFKLLTAEPSQDALSKVVQFARATGDVHALSNVDLKLLALTYMLEVEAHGSSHLREQPPPLQLLPKSNLKHKDPPGWGSNVPNPEEWEEIGRLDEQALRADGDRKSRILGLQTLSLEVPEQPPAADANGSIDDLCVRLSDAGFLRDTNDDVKHLSPKDNVSEDSSSKPPSSRGGRNRTREPFQVEGKFMVSVGVDATKGQNQEEPGEWEKACSRSTRRKHQRRAARIVLSASSVFPASMDAHKAGDINRKDGSASPVLSESAQQLQDRADAASDSRVQAEEDDLPELLDLEDEDDDDGSWCRASESELADRDEDISASESRHHHVERDFSERDEGPEINLAGLTPAAVYVNEIDSEESPGGNACFRSSIACMTPDYALQNVLLQIGLRLVSAGGLQVHELHRWVLKCQACNHVTADVGRMFCPKCGNGGTLYRMSVTVGANGILHGGRQRRVNLRGTRYSLPLPKGGREGALQNPILREDQLPQKLLNPKNKKVSFSEGLDSCDAADVFTKNSKTNARRGPNLGNAAAIFSGRKNPNERRVSRRH